MGNSIAVCIQVFNEGKYLAETINSVLSQTFENFDLIISDNHSTDSTAEIIRDFQSRDKRVISWKPEIFCRTVEHGRYLANRVAQMDYEITVSLGGHDLISSQYIELLCAAYQANPNASMLVGSGYEIDPEGKVLQKWPSMPELNGRFTWLRPSIILMALEYNLAAFGFCPTKTWKNIEVRHDCMGVDHLWLAEVSLHGDIIVVPDAVIYTRRTAGAGDYSTYFKKHISDEMKAEDVVADFEKQLEWVCHINDLAFANHPEGIKNIHLASALGSYFTRYGTSHLGSVSGALEMWLNSDSGRNIASRLNDIGGIFKSTRNVMSTTN